MPVDMEVWRRLVIDALGSVGDEALQRTVWFNLPGNRLVGDPNEFIISLLGDASFQEYLEREDNGLTDEHLTMGRELLRLMEDFCAATPEFLKPQDIMDDPRWVTIRDKAMALRTSLGWPAGAWPSWPA